MTGPSAPDPRRETEPIDPVDEMVRVLTQTLSANELRLATTRGGYVGGGKPHATLDSDPGATEAIARGLLARKVAEPSRVLAPPQPHAQQGREPVTPQTEAGRRLIGADIWTQRSLLMEESRWLARQIAEVEREAAADARDLALREATIAARNQYADGFNAGLAEAADRAAGPLDAAWAAVEAAAPQQTEYEYPWQVRLVGPFPRVGMDRTYQANLLHFDGRFSEEIGLADTPAAALNALAARLAAAEGEPKL